MIMNALVYSELDQGINVETKAWWLFFFCFFFGGGDKKR